MTLHCPLTSPAVRSQEELQAALATAEEYRQQLANLNRHAMSPSVPRQSGGGQNSSSAAAEESPGAGVNYVEVCDEGGSHAFCQRCPGGRGV